MTDPSALNYKILDKEFPLCSNCLSLVIGGTGSGKSYFTYNYLLPTYVERFKVLWILICSRTASCDATLRASLDKCDANVVIDPYIEQLFETAQQVRAQALKTEYLERMVKAKNSKEELAKIKHLVTQMKSYPIIQSELRDLISIIENVLDEDNYTIINHGIVGLNGDPDREEGYVDKYASKIIRDDRDSIIRHYKAHPDNPADLEPDAVNEDDLSSENEDACIQFVTLENPVLTKIAEDNRYDEDESEPEKTTIELNFGIVLKRKPSTRIAKRLIQERIKFNLENLKIAARDVYGPTYQPMLIIVDDNAVSNELYNQRSQFTQLCLTRRHLHCNIVILVQGVSYINTNIRRNATSYHLLPTMSKEDLKLIQSRLPEGLLKDELQDKYIQNIHAKDRDQQTTHIFIASNPPKVIDGLPDCIAQYKL